MNYNDLIAKIAADFVPGIPKGINAEKLNGILNDIAQFANETRGDFQGSAAPTDNPGTPATPVYYIAESSGTYTNFGGLVVDVTQGVNYLSFVPGDGWSKTVVPVDLSGCVQSSNIASKTGKNLFNKQTVITGQYIDTGNGAIQSNALWARSALIDVVAGTSYVLTGLPSVTSKAVRFENSSGGLVSFILVTNPTFVFTVPVGAVKLTFTVKRDTDPANYDLIQLEAGTSATDYEPYFIAIEKIEGKDLMAKALSSYQGISEPSEKVALHGYSSSSPKTVYQIETIINQFAESETSPNIFNKNENIYGDSSNGRYVNSGVDAGIFTGIGSAGWNLATFPISSITPHTISGWMSSRTEIAFFFSVWGTPIETGVNSGLISSGALSLFGSSKFEGVATFTPPPGCLWAAITIANASEADSVFEFLQVEIGSSNSEYSPYGLVYKIKEEALPNNQDEPLFVVSLDNTNESNCYVLVKIGVNELRQGIRPFRGSALPFDTRFSYLNGVLVKQTSDDAAPYRIDGGTIGANHDGGIYNSNKVTKMFIDGVEVTDFVSKYYPTQSFKVVEYYDVTGFTTSGVVARVSYTYDFDKWGGCTLYTDILGVQSVALQDIMFVMSERVEKPYSLLVPKSLPFTHESVAYDFSVPTDMASFSVTNRIDFTPARCTATGIFCDRAISYKTGLAYAVGYLPIQSAEVATRRTLAVRKALQISQTEKIYMSAIDDVANATLSPNEYYSVVAYKNFFVPQHSDYSFYIVSYSDSYYLFLDVKTAITSKITPPVELVGLIMTVVESSQVTIINASNSGSLSFSAFGKGYVILKFSR